MGFRRLSYLKLYSLFCTTFIIFLLSTNWHTSDDLANKNSKLIKELKTLRKLARSRSHGGTQQTIHLITPTYARLTQKADMTRLLYTLLHVDNLHWIIVEDDDEETELMARFIDNIPTKISVTHLHQKTPKMDKLATDDPSWLKPRGVQQRNAGIEFLLENFGKNDEGYVYFLDDDNTYNIEIFDEIRKIGENEVGVWPVGIVGKLRYEGPVCKNGKVESWFTAWKPDRPFPLDMAGFSVPLRKFFDAPEARFQQRVPRGYQESYILKELGLDRSHAVGLANDCRDVLVWHTRTEKPRMDAENKLLEVNGHASDLTIEI